MQDYCYEGIAKESSSPCDSPPPEYDHDFLDMKQALPLPAHPSEHVRIEIYVGEPPHHLVAINEPRPLERPVDPWALAEQLDVQPSMPWKQLSLMKKIKKVLFDYFGKMIALLLLLYIFICSLTFLSDAFRLLGGKTAGKVFTDNEILENPIAGLMIGVLATVLLQSSSTSTSIVVTMCASGILDVGPAIPIVMGANIGTSLTNTIVSLAQGSDRNQFRRAFGGATVHDCFNWMSVLVLLPLEVLTGYLYKLTDAVVNSLDLEAQSGGKKLKLLSMITEPLTKRVIQLDKAVIEKIAVEGSARYANVSLVKHWCKFGVIYQEIVDTGTTGANATTAAGAGVSGVNTTLQGVIHEVKVGIEKCHFLFHDCGLSDSAIGVILLVVSLIAMCTALILLVKLLNSMLGGSIASAIRKTINADFPGYFSWLTGYFAIVVGAALTILVQSSSIFTSALTPLVGLGIIKLDRVYPLTLGSNIGTTGTGLLAALASSPGGQLQAALQIALAHLFFNMSGIALFYPVPFMRVPIKMARVLGNTTAKYRWFAGLYLVSMFFLLPAAVFALSLAGITVLVAVVIPVLTVLGVVVVINIIQHHRPQLLPCQVLRDWRWLPEWARSLDPLDRLLSHCCRCCHPTLCATTNTAQERRLLGGGSSAPSSCGSSNAPSSLPSRQPSKSNLCSTNLLSGNNSPETNAKLLANFSEQPISTDL